MTPTSASSGTAPERSCSRGGPGVGVVTRTASVSKSAARRSIPVPRRNIVDNVRAVAGELLDHDGLEVTISVPGGEEMAKTLNTRLASSAASPSLGTTGIVRPIRPPPSAPASSQAAVDVAARQGQTSVIFTTGGRTEKIRAMKQLPELDESCFVQMGDFVKAPSPAPSSASCHVYVGAMVGKLTKWARGWLPMPPLEGGDRPTTSRRFSAGGRRTGRSDREIRAAETARLPPNICGARLAVDFQNSWQKASAASGPIPGDYHLAVLVCDFRRQFHLAASMEEDALNHQSINHRHSPTTASLGRPQTGCPVGRYLVRFRD